MPPPAPSPSRAQRLEQLTNFEPDVIVVGGGITGAGIALDLALRGIRTLIVERKDWASATSSSSSRLIHGGLRYLEQYEFGLVRDSCLERALLLENASGLVWPENFLFPIHRGDRVGRLKLAAGLMLYTLLSIPRALGIPSMLPARKAYRLIPGVDPIKLRGAGQYLDGATDDARLTLAVIKSAISAGTLAISRMEMLSIDDGANGTIVKLRDTLVNQEYEVKARSAVLAGGPFTESMRKRADLGGDWISPTRGTHIVVHRDQLPTDGAVIFPSKVDGRVMFLIPWPRYTIIGTTDLDADPELPIRATRDEVEYLLESVRGLIPLTDLCEDDVVSTWAGLRPLLAAPKSNPSARSREERVERNGNIFTIAGGKLTGYRSMAEKLGVEVSKAIGKGDHSRHSPSRHHKLYGAFAERSSRPTWSRLSEDGMPQPTTESRARTIAQYKRYSAMTEEVRLYCAQKENGEEQLDAETLLGEVDWAVEHEDCLTLCDFFYRRTDLGLGPLEIAVAALEKVAMRMEKLLGWDQALGEQQRSELLAKLAETHAWREDPA
ncbi:MAG: glycerol-3-phosphate dehydrogenase [Planctomycetota bacterium]|jgi:glycerol-3-phosphate dehydrogenase